MGQDPLPLNDGDGGEVVGRPSVLGEQTLRRFGSLRRESEMAGGIVPKDETHPAAAQPTAGVEEHDRWRRRRFVR
jgi:hypothetical protein